MQKTRQDTENGNLLPETSENFCRSKAGQLSGGKEKEILSPSPTATEHSFAAHFTGNPHLVKASNCCLKTSPLAPTSHQCKSALFTRVWLKQLYRNKNPDEWVKMPQLPLTQGELRESSQWKKHLECLDLTCWLHPELQLWFQQVIINQCCWSHLDEPRSQNLALHLVEIIYLVFHAWHIIRRSDLQHCTELLL